MTLQRTFLIAAGGLLLAAAAACTWQGLRPPQAMPQRLYLVGELVHADPARVVEVAADYLGAGYFYVDLGGLRDAVAALPWIAEAAVHRRWPDAVVIRLHERQPLALWGKTGVVAKDGSVFTPRDGKRPQGLPQLSGPPDSAARMAGLLNKLQHSLHPAGLRIRGLRLDARGSWSLTLASGLVLRLGRTAVESRLLRFVRYARPLLGDRLRTAAYVDLRYADGFAVGGAAAAHAKEKVNDKAT